jgi:hypothetical protein
LVLQIHKKMKNFISILFVFFANLLCIECYIPGFDAGMDVEQISQTLNISESSAFLGLLVVVSIFIYCVVRKTPEVEKENDYNI